jgi:SulP family sulfate permease
MITTFAATLLLPVAAAVGIGVALSFLLNINREALDVRIVELVAGEDGSVSEKPAPAVLRSNQIVVLNVYGSLFYAGARTFESSLPRVVDAEKPVVIVRIRGRMVVGATAFSVLSGYAALLEERGGRLYLSGVAPELLEQFKASGRVTSGGPIHYVEATPTLGESTRAAIADAEGFLLGEAPVSSDPAEPPPSWAARVGSRVSRLWRGPP